MYEDYAVRKVIQGSGVKPLSMDGNMAEFNVRPHEHTFYGTLKVHIRV